MTEDDKAKERAAAGDGDIRETWSREQLEAKLAMAERRHEKALREWERADLCIERMLDRMEKTILLLQDGAKALSILNSAAAVAMLAFSQALVASGKFGALKPFVMGALVH